MSVNETSNVPIATPKNVLTILGIDFNLSLSWSFKGKALIGKGSSGYVTEVSVPSADFAEMVLKMIEKENVAGQVKASVTVCQELFANIVEKLPRDDVKVWGKLAATLQSYQEKYLPKLEK